LEDIDSDKESLIKPPKKLKINNIIQKEEQKMASQISKKEKNEEEKYDVDEIFSFGGTPKAPPKPPTNLASPKGQENPQTPKAKEVANPGTIEKTQNVAECPTTISKTQIVEKSPIKPIALKLSPSDESVEGTQVVHQEDSKPLKRGPSSALLVKQTPEVVDSTIVSSAEEFISSSDSEKAIRSSQSDDSICSSPSQKESNSSQSQESYDESSTSQTNTPFDIQSFRTRITTPLTEDPSTVTSVVNLEAKSNQQPSKSRFSGK